MSIYKLKTTILAVMHTEVGHTVPVTIPENALISVAEERVPAASDEYKFNFLIEVQWEGKSIRMFEQDINQRCERVGPEPL